MTSSLCWIRAPSLLWERFFCNCRVAWDFWMGISTLNESQEEKEVGINGVAKQEASDPMGSR